MVSGRSCLFIILEARSGRNRYTSHRAESYIATRWAIWSGGRSQPVAAQHAIAAAAHLWAECVTPRPVRGRMRPPRTHGKRSFFGRTEPGRTRRRRETCADPPSFAVRDGPPPGAPCHAVSPRSHAPSSSPRRTRIPEKKPKKERKLEGRKLISETVAGDGGLAF